MKRFIIFDFDGTLINTNDMIEEGLDVFALAYRGEPLSREEHEFLAGKPLMDQMAYISLEKWEEMTEAFKAWYLKAHAKMAKPFEGIDELLHYLKDSHYQLAIVSNNSRGTIDFGLRQLGLEGVFDLILSCDDVAYRKPNPEGLIKAMTLLGAKQEECLFIGDSSNDILAGKNAGVDSVLVGWTALEKNALLALNPDYYVERPVELLQIIGIVDEISA